MWAPIVVFAYNRLDHLRKTLETLERAEGAKQSKLYIFADGYRSDKDKYKVLSVQEYLKEYKEKNVFEEIHLQCSDSNRGLAQSVICGVGAVLKQYGRAIVVEDDLQVSGDFILYMNAALNYYENNQRIWAISGWTPEVPELAALRTDTFLWYRSNSWGWATWLDRWKTIDWDMKDYPAFRFSAGKRRKMNRGGADMADMLDMQMEGRINSWAIRFAYAESMNDQLTVFPKITKVQNCGFDGSGTNCHNEERSKGYDQNSKEETPLNFGKDVWKWGEDVLRGKLDRKVYRFYSGSRLHCLKWRIKSILNRTGIKKF